MTEDEEGYEADDYSEVCFCASLEHSRDSREKDRGRSHDSSSF